MIHRRPVFFASAFRNAHNRFNSRQLHIICQRQTHKQQRCRQSTAENKRCAASPSGMAFIGKRTEQGQHEHRQHIIQRHDDPGPELVQPEFICQDLGNDTVVNLPEYTDQKKGKSHQYRSFIIEFHISAPCCISESHTDLLYHIFSSKSTRKPKFYIVLTFFD